MFTGIFFTAVFLCVVFCAKVWKLKKEQGQLQLYQEHLETYYHALLKHSKSLKQLQEEMEQEINEPGAMPQKKEFWRSKDYGEQFNQYYHELKMLDYCGIRIIDCILYSRMAILREAKIRLEIEMTDINLGNGIEIDVFYLFINIMDMAIDACRTVQEPNEKYICLQAKKIAEQNVIEMTFSRVKEKESFRKRRRCICKAVRTLGGTSLFKSENDFEQMMISLPVKEG